MGELSKLPNIGKVVEEQLNQTGIYTETDLPEHVKADLKEFYQAHIK